MSLYRSLDMIRCQILLPVVSTYESVARLGEIGIIQFIDLNEEKSLTQRRYISEIRRIEDMERRMKLFKKELDKRGMNIPDSVVSVAPTLKELSELDVVLEKHEATLTQFCSNYSALQIQYVKLNETMHVLEQSERFFRENEKAQMASGLLNVFPGRDRERRSVAVYDKMSGRDGVSPFVYAAGVVPLKKAQVFLKIVLLMSHGNILLRFMETADLLVDAVTKEKEKKPIFVALIHGQKLQNKLEKLVQGYNGSIYMCPETSNERLETLKKVTRDLRDLDIVMKKSNEQINHTLDEILKDYNNWHVKLVKLKSCFYTLNMFHLEGHSFVAEGYIPVCDLDTLKTTLKAANMSVGVDSEPVLTPIMSTMLPTHFKLNKFTSAFHIIIEAYGVCRYKEINPALFTIISFPFLFSVMFGDAGHGLVMLMFAMFLCIQEKTLKPIVSKNEIYSIIFGGRYLILLMSLFSIHAGIIYNDMFSKPLNLFGSEYKVVYKYGVLLDHPELQLDVSDPHVYSGKPYVFGIDPIWELSENGIIYLNSFKKKISIIFGVSQMLLGVILRLFNNLYFRNYMSIICEFVPMVIFLMSIFGYMSILIFSKWLIAVDLNDEASKARYYHCSPNILIGFINMFMFNYDKGTAVPCGNYTWFSNQKSLQSILVLLAVVSIFWILFAKPVTLLLQSKQHKVALQEETPKTVKVEVDSNQLDPNYLKPFTIPVNEEEPFDFGEIFIHQCIHMIEFCLGCVSHTASYLRLWALSLAHAQLSDVLWDMLLIKGYKAAWTTPLRIVFIFALTCPFAILTVVILLIMEGLSAFLHTLRLHWVEFNSKFYSGDGIPFMPLCFEKLLDIAAEEQ